MRTRPCFSTARRRSTPQLPTRHTAGHQPRCGGCRQHQQQKHQDRHRLVSPIPRGGGEKGGGWYKQGGACHECGTARQAAECDEIPSLLDSDSPEASSRGGNGDALGLPWARDASSGVDGRRREISSKTKLARSTWPSPGPIGTQLHPPLLVRSGKHASSFFGKVRPSIFRSPGTPWTARCSSATRAMSDERRHGAEAPRMPALWTSFCLFAVAGT